jgi:hypothetical protein
VNTEPYWRDVVQSEREKGNTHLLMPLSAFETLLDRLDFAKSELARVEGQLNRHR